MTRVRLSLRAHGSSTTTVGNGIGVVVRLRAASDKESTACACTSTTHVRLWLHPQPEAQHIVVRLCPLRGCALPLLSDSVSAIVTDYETCRRWLDGLTSSVHMMWRRRNGRHIRERTMEATAWLLDDCFCDMRAMLATPRWRAAVSLATGDGWPLPASLELLASSTVHYLCLLRGRLANGAIVADVWRRIVAELLPCVERFGYSRRAAGGGPWVVLRPLAPLPTERFAGWTREAVGLLLGDDDAARVDDLCTAWRGTGSGGPSQAAHATAGRSASADGGSTLAVVPLS